MNSERRQALERWLSAALELAPPSLPEAHAIIARFLAQEATDTEPSEKAQPAVEKEAEKEGKDEAAGVSRTMVAGIWVVFFQACQQ